jgi:hypothetical protein
MRTHSWRCFELAWLSVDVSFPIEWRARHDRTPVLTALLAIAGIGSGEPSGAPCSRA